MKEKWKYVLGILGLTAFAVCMTLLIFKKNASRASVEEEEPKEVILVEKQKDEVEEPPLMFPDTREYTDEELALMDGFEPEGDDCYEVDEAPPTYHVTVINYEEIYENYDDFKICNELPYYLHTYFNLCTGNLDEMYEVTLTEGSCETSEYSSYVTLEATVDKYPGMVIYIEYDKLNRVFGIKSDLGDYSLEALKQNGKHYIIEYTPEDEDDSDYGAPDTVPVDPDEG